MEQERQQLQVLNAEAEARTWHKLYAQTGKMLEANERLIARAEEQNRELRRDALREIGLANKWQADAAALRKQIEK